MERNNKSPVTMHCLMKAWKENEQSLHGWLLKQTGDHELSRDLLQDVFLKSLEHRERFCTLEHSKSWLFTITRNTLIDASRKHHVTEEFTESFTAPEQSDAESPPLLQLESCMLRVLTELKEAEREVIEHCDIQKLSQQSYAQKSGLSLPATKARLQRARRQLRKKMVKACKIQFDESGVCDFTPRH